MVNDNYYHYTGGAVPAARINEADILGVITSTVSFSTAPSENGQSNIAPVGSPYVRYGENLAVLMQCISNCPDREPLHSHWYFFERHTLDDFDEEPPQATAPTGGNAIAENFWYIIAGFGSLVLLMRVYLINRKYSKRYPNRAPPTLPMKWRFQGDKEFDNVRTEIIEIDDDDSNT
jgi:hypothetical protein